MKTTTAAKILAEIESQPFLYYREGNTAVDILGLPNGRTDMHFRDANDQWQAARIARDLIAADVVKAALIETRYGDLKDENLNLIGFDQQF